MARFSRFLVVAGVFAFAALAWGQTPNETGALPESAADGVDDAEIPNPRPTVAEFLTQAGEFSVLLSAVGTIPNLTERLSIVGARFTVFAPTDSAFTELALIFDPNVDTSDTSAIVNTVAGAVSSLRDVPPVFTDLRSVLVYHMLGQALSLQELEEKGSATTMQGDDLQFADGKVIDGDESREDATVIRNNILTLNGWVNVIDSVLLPFNLDKALTTLSAATATNTPSPSTIPTDGSEPEGSDDPDTVVVPVVPVVVVPTDDETLPQSTDELDDGAIGSSDEEALASPSAEFDSDDEDESACFPASATVRLADGSSLSMSELNSGHSIHVSESADVSRVFLFTHKSPTAMSLFRELTTASGHTVLLTRNHYVYSNGRLSTAASVNVGDELRTVDGVSRVVRARMTRARGLYAPHTVHGDVVVDGVVVSGYSRTLHPRVAHAVLAPVRVVAGWGWKEPLGSLLYEGAEALVPFLPKGTKTY